MTFIRPYLARSLLRLFVSGLPLALLAACGGGGGSAPPSLPVPSIPASVSMTYGVKSLSLAWGAATSPTDQGAVTYRVYEDLDGSGPTAPTMIAQSLSGTGYAHAISGLLSTRFNAQYTVQACNNAGCSASTPAVTPNLTQAIGSLSPSDSEEKNGFGSSVALSADGSTLAVGAQGSNMTDTGVVRVFARTASGWVQQAIIKASTPILGERFGIAVALSAEGGTLAVGAAGKRDGGIGYDMIQGNYFVTASAGTAYVYVRTGSNWAQQASVTASNAQRNDSFGASLALSGDGNTLAVGAYGEASSDTGINGNGGPVSTDAYYGFQGAAYIFKRAGGTWTQTTHIKPTNTAEGDKYRYYGYFGLALALSSNGNTLAVGAPGKTRWDGASYVRWEGATYIFSQTGGNWEQQTYISRPGGAVSTSYSFGSSVALSADGNTLVAGARGDQSSATGINNPVGSSGTLLSAGAAYVYTRTGSNWAQQAYVKASNTQSNQNFGSSVAVSADGNTLAVGAMGESSTAVGINGDQTSTGAPGSGAVYLFGRNGSNWAQQAYMKASKLESSFGIALTLSSDGKDMAVGSSSAAYFY